MVYRAAIQFFIEGEQCVSIPIAKNGRGDAIYTSTFYCNWTDNYGQRAVQQMQEGVKESATIVLPYIAELFAILQKNNCTVFSLERQKYFDISQIRNIEKRTISMQALYFGI